MDYQIIKRINLYHPALMTMCAIFLSACFNGSTSTNQANSQIGSSVDLAPPASNTTTLTANIEVSGQQSVTGATITVKAADGTLLATVSNTDAHYQVMLPDQAVYPYIITAASGVDLVSGSNPGYPLISVVSGPDDTIANINTFSTLIAKTAEFMPGGVTSANLGLARETILQQLNFGLDTALVPDPITTTISAENAASLVKANEALSEMIRRVHTALQVVGYDLSENDIILAMASDMTDGYLDGNGARSSDALIAATVNIISGQVLVEALSNNLNVNGAWAGDLLDNAIRATLPEATVTIADVTVTAAMLQQTSTAIGTAQAIDNSESLSTLALIVNSLNPEIPAADIEAILPQERANDFNDAMILTASASDSQLASINASVHPANEIPANDSPLALAWYSNPGEIVGYIVYFGSSPESATTIASETSGTSVKYYTETDLGLGPGDSVCFRLKAFNLSGLSEFSGALCMLI